VLIEQQGHGAAGLLRIQVQQLHTARQQQRADLIGQVRSCYVVRSGCCLGVHSVSVQGQGLELLQTGHAWALTHRHAHLAQHAASNRHQGLVGPIHPSEDRLGHHSRLGHHLLCTVASSFSAAYSCRPGPLPSTT